MKNNNQLNNAADVAHHLADIVSVFPDSWQMLWRERHTVRCMTCGQIRLFDSLLAITHALLSTCPDCGGDAVIAYDGDGNQASVRCGTGHGAALGVIGCIHLRDFMISGTRVKPPLCVPADNDAIVCGQCEHKAARTGWDVDDLALYCLFCMGAVIRKAIRENIPLCKVVPSER